MSDAEGVQPDEGQGAQADAPWAQYLDRLPEEAREAATEVFREWDGNVTKKFQEAAQFRQQMEPFADIVQDWTPDAARWAKGFYTDATTNPQAVQQFYEAYAKENGLSVAEAIAEVDELDPFAEPADVRKEIESIIAARFEERDQAARQEQEQAQRLEAAISHIEGQMTAEQERLGDRFDRDAIEGLAGKYVDSDPENAVKLAAQEWETKLNAIEKQILQGKVDTSQPAAESGGVVDAAPERVTSLERAGQLAAERLRASRAA